MVSEPFSEIYRTVQECCPVRNPLLDYSEILRNISDVKERKKRWKLTFCNSFECANALSHLLENNLESLLNNEEKLRLEENIMERRAVVAERKEELNRKISGVEEQLWKTVEGVLSEIKKLSMECAGLEEEFTKKTSNIPSILEKISKSDVKFESEYLGKKVTVSDVKSLQETRKKLLTEFEELMSIENKLRKEIQELEMKWNSYRQMTRRLENEILLKKTETSHQAIQIDEHINRRLSTALNIQKEASQNFESRDSRTHLEENDKHTEDRRNRRNSVAKWIGRLSISNEKDRRSGFEVKCNESTSSISSIEDKDEEVQGELQVLNLLSIIKIDQLGAIENQPELNLRIDPSPLLSRFLDPGFKYAEEMEPIRNRDYSATGNGNKQVVGMFSTGHIDFKIRTKNQYDGTKTFEEVTLVDENKSINSEDIALFNIFVGELKRNENIPISSIGKLICSTLK
ncbi:hypothetical protein FG386_002406 [Cryptosporidium ryanae]|uniref:uncharacterized protein n=1 Tax=Cryptosporidium ryanae TaxID=515981 RepID=UPI00351A9E8A|nr:hypothetical protein FG386_002406 [Cryptosporidium ryanae]